MQMSRFFTQILMSILLIITISCNNPVDSEESSQQLTKTETYNAVRNGVRLIVAYDDTSLSFVGTVENTTSNTIQQVRVEVHLSNGVELGPTPNVDLTPGQKDNVKLSAAGQSFTWWKVHAETGQAEKEEIKESTVAVG